MEKNWLAFIFNYVNPINVIIGIIVVINFIAIFLYKTQQLQPQINRLSEEVQTCEKRTTSLELNLSTSTAELKAILKGIESDLQIIKMEVTANGLRHNYSVNK